MPVCLVSLYSPIPKNVLTIKMPKLYTKTGDKGYTSLYDGNRISKSSLHFDTLGTIDELSCHIGMLLAAKSHKQHCKNDIKNPVTTLRTIQSNLQDIMSNIAVVNKKKRSTVPTFTEANIEFLENLIDQCETKNKPLKEFVLPGMYIPDAQCQICRVVSRRAERYLFKLDRADYEEEKEDGDNLEMRYVQVNEHILKYMNRLSDFFFAYSRVLNGCNECKYINQENIECNEGKNVN